MLYRIWRYSAMKQKWVEFDRADNGCDMLLATIRAKDRFGGCCVAVEWLVPRAERDQVQELERMAAR